VESKKPTLMIRTKHLLIGEDVGNNLKFWTEGDYYRTPNFDIKIQDSKYEHDWKSNKFSLGKTFWVNAFYGVAIKDLKVDKEIQISFEDYLNKKDPILEWIKNEF